MLKILVLLFLGGCNLSNFNQHVNIGNIIEPDTLKQITPGKSKSEILKLVDKPIIGSIDENVWLYSGYKLVQGQMVDFYSLEVHFEGEFVSKVKFNEEK